MTIDSIKKIDRIAGWIICVILNLHYRLSGIFAKKDKGLPPKKVLLIKYFGIGSIILAQPMVSAVRKAFPEAKLYFLTFSNNREIPKLFGSVDEILCAGLKPLRKFFWDSLKTLLYLRRQKIDIAFDLEFFSRFTSIMTYLTGAGKRIEFYSEILWRGDLFTTGVKFNPYFHARENFLRLAKEAGIDTGKAVSVKPIITGEIKKRAVDILKANGAAEKDIKVCINVNAGELAIERRWPAEYFVRLINRLSAHDIKQVLIGDKESIRYVTRIISDLNTTANIVNLAGKTTLAELAGVLSESALLISNDSGPLHLADALGIPVVAFFGPETPVIYGPKNNTNLIFYKELMCSPCLTVLNAKTVICKDDNKCMRSISPDEVFDAIIEKYPRIFMPEPVV